MNDVTSIMAPENFSFKCNLIFYEKGQFPQIWDASSGGERSDNIQSLVSALLKNPLFGTGSYLGPRDYKKGAEYVVSFLTHVRDEPLFFLNKQLRKERPTETDKVIIRGAQFVDGQWVVYYSLSKVIKSQTEKNLEKLAGKAIAITFTAMLMLTIANIWSKVIMGTVGTVLIKSCIEGIWGDHTHTTEEASSNRLYGIFYEAFKERVLIHPPNSNSLIKNYDQVISSPNFAAKYGSYYS